MLKVYFFVIPDTIRHFWHRISNKLKPNSFFIG